MPYTLALNQLIPYFCLAGTDGKVHSPASFTGAQVLIIFFTCNHCPYVIGSDEITKRTAERFTPQGAAFIAINSNSCSTHAEDSFFHMVERMQRHHFPWVYLYDETQEIATIFGALRTPHFYVFDQKRKLRYCGRATDSPKNSAHITTNELGEAIEDLLADRPVRCTLTNPIGCNIKWKGQDRHWMPHEACDLV